MSDKHRIYLSRLPDPISTDFSNEFCAQFGTDIQTVPTILQNIPIVLLDDVPVSLVETLDGLLQKFRSLGASVHIISTLPEAKIPKLTWPSPPPILKAAYKLAELHIMTCPSCGARFNLEQIAGPTMRPQTPTPSAPPPQDTEKDASVQKTAPPVSVTQEAPVSAAQEKQPAPAPTPAQAPLPESGGDHFGLEWISDSSGYVGEPMSLEAFEAGVAEIDHKKIQEDDDDSIPDAAAVPEIEPLAQTQELPEIPDKPPEDSMDDLPDKAMMPQQAIPEVFELGLPSIEPDAAPVSQDSVPDAPRESELSSGEYSLFLTRISSDSKRLAAIDLITAIKGIDTQAAEKIMEKTIIPVVQEISQEDAESLKKEFQSKGLTARITRKKA